MADVSMNVLMQYGDRFSQLSQEDSSSMLIGTKLEGQTSRKMDVPEVRAELEKELSREIESRDSEVTKALSTLNAEEAARQQEQEAKKAQSRAEYGIGWKATEQVPKNAGRVAEAEDQPALGEGMCCLVLDESTGALGVDTTIEPAAAVNLEYLSIALQVRSQEGREPFFSLDPVDPQNATMQEKRFEPDWLAGTSVGEVMFQADYHLKELSMGQYEQPVVGMKSCLDYSQDGTREKEWNAREWFVVKDADVAMSEDNVLVPYINMGVEAREQIEGENGLVDAPLTKPDHPLVKYAETFTRNFDLIAERKSVVYHLRELAKASVLAKFLFESEVELEPSWFDLADEAKVACALEVPQLWNERVESKLQVQDGMIVDAEKAPRMNGVYGGVQFGLDRFTVGARPATLSATVVGARGVAPRVSAALSMATSVTGGLRAPTMMRAASAMRAGVPSARAAVSMRAGGVARGVAFGLDRFTVGARPATLSATVVGARGVAPRVSAALSMATSVTGGLRAPTMMRAASAMRAGVPSARAAVSMRAGGVARGVAFGLDRFTVGARPATLSATVVGARGVAPRVSAALSMATSVTGGLRAPTMMRAASAMRAGVPSARAAVSMRAGGVARGVDLNLDEFDLSEAGTCDGELKATEAGAPVASAFWSCLDGSADGVFKAEDVKLFQEIYNSTMSDRRDEGDLFVPPETNAAYVQKLRSLVKEEGMLREERKQRFLSSDFDESNAGGLFPSSWKASFQVAKKAGDRLCPRPDFAAQQDLLTSALASATPSFDKRSEDGARFCIYRLGGLEVRTTQECGAAEEVVGAVFTHAC